MQSPPHLARFGPFAMLGSLLVLGALVETSSGQSGARQNPRSTSPAPEATALDPASEQDPEQELSSEPDELEPFRLPAYISPNQQLEYFRIADYDSSGWISFEEARESLVLDRQTYQIYDSNIDGRISQEEFEDRYLESIRLTGGFRPPIPAATGTVAPPRTAEQLRNSFDRNLDARLGVAELDLLIKEYGLPDRDGKQLLILLDEDTSGYVDPPELVRLSQILDAFKSLPPRVFDADRPGSLEELYGERTPRENTRGLAEPPFIRGPVRPFYRLDADGDEDIDEQDLFALQFPLTLPVRASSVLAALDTDGNGALDRDEFRAAME